MKFHGLGYNGLAPKGNYELEKHSEKSSTNKILSNNMYVRAPMLKRSVKLSSKDNSTFIKRKCMTTSILPTDFFFKELFNSKSSTSHNDPNQ
jgi:hypothetical protein